MATMGNLPEVVSREEWLAARKELLAKEKELTRARDRVNADRRRLPMVRVDKPYAFEGPDGTVSLLDLFEGRPQLVMHHFMWTYDIDADGTEHPRDTGCPSCSSAADGIAGLRQLHARDTTLAAVSRAPYAKLAAYRERMGWTFPWYSSAGGDFNYDFHATVDDRVAPVQVFHRTEAELAEGRNALVGEHARRLAGHERVPAGGRRGLPHLLDLRPRHRGVPQRLPLARPHRARPPGGLGGAEGPRDPARHAGRRPRDAYPGRVRRLRRNV
ncbi:DUF899 domain-containing protein [Streptomyces sp. GLT-R25]